MGKGLKGLGVAVRFAKGWCECVASGKDAWGCAATTLTDDWLCLASMAFGAPNPKNPFSLLAVAVPAVGAPAAALYNMLFEPENPYCDPSGMDKGPGTLKCCKYTPDQNGCHSAFNSPTPINCEGNPVYAGSAASFGPCMVPQTGFGCLCDHIPECAADGQADTSDYGKGHRRSNWFRGIEAAYVNRLAADDDDCSMSFTFFEGCRGWLNVMVEGEPFAHLQGGPVSPHNGAMVLELNREFAVNAAFRVMFAVPNGLKRFDYVSARTWDDEQKTGYLAAVPGPEAELGKFLGTCGLSLLKDSLPERWELLAAPAPEEGETDKELSLSWQDGCLQGEVATIADVFASVEGAGVELQIQIDDPEADYNPHRFDPLTIDWGDHRVSHVFYALDHANTFTHTYRRAGDYTVTLTHVNSAGLTAVGAVQVVADDWEPVVEARTIVGVSLALAAESETPLILGVWGIDEGGSQHYLGRLWADAGGGEPVALAVQALTTQGPQALVALKLRGVEEGGTGTAAWLLQGIETLEFRSGGVPAALAWGAVPPGAVTGDGGEPAWSEEPAGVRLPAQNTASYIIALPCATRQCGMDEVYELDCGKCQAYDICLDSGLCEPGEAPVSEPEADTVAPPAEGSVEEPHKPEIVEVTVHDLAVSDEGSAVDKVSVDHAVPGFDNSGSAEDAAGDSGALADPGGKGESKGGGGCGSTGDGVPVTPGGSTLVLVLVLLALAAMAGRRKVNG